MSHLQKGSKPVMAAGRELGSVTQRLVVISLTRMHISWIKWWVRLTDILRVREGRDTWRPPGWASTSSWVLPPAPPSAGPPATSAASPEPAFPAFLRGKTLVGACYAHWEMTAHGVPVQISSPTNINKTTTNDQLMAKGRAWRGTATQQLDEQVARLTCSGSILSLCSDMFGIRYMTQS